jgi:single-strand DNA-binding protein
MGRLVRDPETRYTQTNTPVTNFTLACERDYADSQGNRATDFFDCVAWRSTGEFVSKYFQKGSMIAVSGRLQMREWTDRDGNKRKAAEIVADNCYFAGKSERRQEAKPEQPQQNGFSDLDDDDFGGLPF